MKASVRAGGPKEYPFSRLDEIKRELHSAGHPVIDLGVGETQEETPSFIRAATAQGIRPTAPYPRAGGLPELREVAAGWCRRRFGVTLDPDHDIIPTLGTKEAIFSLAQILFPETSGRNIVVTTTPGYPVPSYGARVVRAKMVELTLSPEEGFLPEHAALEAIAWDRVALLWINYPNNPTGATAPLSFFNRLASLAAERDFVLASDEAYVDVYYEAPPPSALQVQNRENVLAFHSLSKRSAMAGYRSGFAAGASWMIERLRRHRAASGVVPQEFVQRGSIAAWQDDNHAAALRASYAVKRPILLEAFTRRGLKLEASEATFFLWLRVPDGSSGTEVAEHLARAGVIVAPEAFFGKRDDHLRVSLTPPLAGCEAAAEIVDRVL